MATYFVNTVFNNFDTATYDDISNIYSNKTGSLNVSVYSIEVMKKINELVKILPDCWIGYTQINNDTTLEKVAYDIYSNASYWDVLLVLNQRLPLFDMPYNYDILMDMAEEAVSDYETNVIRRTMKDEEREEFEQQYLAKLNANNENLRVIKYVYPEYIHDFLDDMSELGIIA